MELDHTLELAFAEHLEDLVYGFGSGSQEGIKEALKQCQNDFGCVSVAHQVQIAEAFATPINTVKVFMKLNKGLKESIVEHEIICCTGGRCHKAGAIAVMQAISKFLGISHNQVTADGKIRFQTQNCFKKCNLGPNVWIDGKFYHHMDPKQISVVLKNLIK